MARMFDGSDIRWRKYAMARMFDGEEHLMAIVFDSVDDRWGGN